MFPLYTGVMKKNRIKLPLFEGQGKAFPWDSPKKQINLVSVSCEDPLQSALAWLHNGQASGYESLASLVIHSASTLGSSFLVRSQEGGSVFILLKSRDQSIAVPNSKADCFKTTRFYGAVVPIPAVHPGTLLSHAARQTLSFSDCQPHLQQNS